MIEIEIMKLCRKILEEHKSIRDSNFYELSFIYDFESGKANVLKIMKRNQDFIAFKYENIDAEFDIERCEEDCCDIFFGCDIENCLITLNEFLEDEEPIVETGNRATDWSPAPEDLATQSDVMKKVFRL